jgi:two-component system response regulator AtoC
MAKPRVLVVDDKVAVLDLLTSVLAGFDVTAVSDSARVALALMDRRSFDVVLTDVRMPHADGHEVLGTVKTVCPETEVIMLTGYATVPDAVAAMRRGAFDYLEKPFDPDDVVLAVARAVEHRRERLTSRLERSGRGGDGEEEAAVSLRYHEALEVSREQASRRYLVALMRHFQGNVTSAAERAGMERESLHRVLKRHGIRPEDFRRVGARDAPARASEPGSEERRG